MATKKQWHELNTGEKIVAIVVLMVFAAIVLGVIGGIISAISGSGNTKIQSSILPAPKKTTSQPKPTATTNSASQQSTQPASTHTVVYQFSLMSGKLTDADMQNVGISWHDPTNGNNQLPNDIGGAVQQINAGSYTVTYHVSSVDNNNLSASVNNYSDPDASVACTILVDNNPIANETAPKSGYSLCSGNSADNQAGN